MKKLIIILAILFTGLNYANAQFLGINTPVPLYRFHVTQNNFGIVQSNANNTAQVGTWVNQGPASVYGWVGTLSNDPFRMGSGSNNNFMSILNNGKVAIGVGIQTPISPALLEIDGQIKINGGTPGTGKVLTSDGTGLATWATPSAFSLPYAVTQSSSSALFSLTNNGSGHTIVGNSSTGDAVRGITTGNSFTSGIYGEGHAFGAYGIYGNSNASVAIIGSTLTGFGISGQATSGVGGKFTSASGYALITDQGNVGIGTLTPTSKLDVSGQVKINSAIGPVLSMVGPGATSSTSSTTNPVVRMGITNDSNYGWVRFENSTGARHFSQRYDLVSTTASINSYALYYGTDQLFTVRGSGSFGLNVSNPLDLLHLSPISATGDVFARISSTTGFTGLRLDNNTGDYQLFSNEFGGLFLDYSTDNYATRTGILTFAPNASNFEMRPAITNNVFLGTSAFRWKEIWSQNALNTSSDRRLKKNINEIKYGLDEVMKLQAVTYNWKDTDDKKLQLGFIAQDVEKIVPEIVTKSGISDEEFERLEKKGEKVTDTYGMQYTGLIPVLVKAIQEQQKVIADKLSRIEQLEEKIQKLSSLEARLSMLENTLNAPKVSNSISNDK